MVGGKVSRIPGSGPEVMFLKCLSSVVRNLRLSLASSVTCNYEVAGLNGCGARIT